MDYIYWQINRRVPTVNTSTLLEIIKNRRIDTGNYVWKFTFTAPPYNRADEAALITGKAWEALSIETRYTMCKACDLKELLEKRTSIRRMTLEGHTGPIYCNSADEFLIFFARATLWMSHHCNDNWLRFLYTTEGLDLLEKLGHQDQRSRYKESYDSLLKSLKQENNRFLDCEHVKAKLREIETSHQILNDAFGARIEKIRECIQIAQTDPNYANRLERLSMARKLYDEGTAIQNAERREEFFAFLPEILALEKCRKKWKGQNASQHEAKPNSKPSRQPIERQDDAHVEAFKARIAKIKGCIQVAQTDLNYGRRLQSLTMAKSLYDEGTLIRVDYPREEFNAFLPQILALEKSSKKWKAGKHPRAEANSTINPDLPNIQRQDSLEKLRAKQKIPLKASLPATEKPATTAQHTPKDAPQSFAPATETPTTTAIKATPITLGELWGELPVTTNSLSVTKPKLDTSSHLQAANDLLSMIKIAISQQTTIGEGATSIVYRGTLNGRVVAIKRFHCTELRSDQTREFEKEAKLSISLKSPYLIETYDYAAEAPYFCTVMEYMPQGSLYQLLGSDVDLPWDKRWVIAMDMACGVEALHSQDIIHRDIKSLNVLIGSGFRAKLADFGQAKCKHASQSTSSRRGETGAVGTVAWLAPEVLRDGAECSKKTDIYSLGVVLWELATREIPFANAPNMMALSLWIMQGKRENLTKVTQPKLVNLIQRCWETNAALRPSAAAARQALEDATPKHVSQETPRMCLFSQ